jgi:uncharacterized membrane protein
MNSLPFQPKHTENIHLTSVYALAESGHLDAAGFRHALHVTEHVPDTPLAWRITEQLLLIFGVGLALLGVVFAVAYNWEYLTVLLGSWGKFTAMQLLVFCTFGFALFKGLDTSMGRIALVAAIVLVGPLLALFGQTYQTGADTFTLFLTWAGLTVAWVLASRNAAAWLMWFVILEAALIAYIFSHLGWLGMLFGWFNGWLMVSIANLCLLALWELATTRFDWLRRGASFSAAAVPRLVAWVLMAILTVVTCAWILFAQDNYYSGIGEDQKLGIGAIMWLICMGVGYLFYRPKHELFILCGGLFSLLIVILFAIGRVFFWRGDFGAGLAFFPIMAAVVYFYTAWARRWLKGISATPQHHKLETTR